MKRKKLDEFHYHEALNRTYVINDSIERNLCTRPVIKKHNVLKKKIDTISDTLAEVYQIIGSLQVGINGADKE